MKTDDAIFTICCIGVEKRGEFTTNREYARQVLESYLAYPARKVVLTDAEKTAKFRRAREQGAQVVDHLKRQKVGK